MTVRVRAGEEVPERRQVGTRKVNASEPRLTCRNSRRIQKGLGYLSAIEFEEKHYAEQARPNQRT